jgi:WD40 repeat protein
MSFDITPKNKFDTISGLVRALAFDKDNQRLWIGTFGSDLYSCKVDFKGSVSDIKVATQGHYSPKKKDNNELWGLAVIPGKEQYVTVSDDGTLRVFDQTSRKQIKMIDLN